MRICITAGNKLLPAFSSPLLLLLFITLLSGCSSIGHKKVNGLANTLNQQPPEQVLSQLQTIVPGKRDTVQYNLNVGTLQFLSQDYDNAVINLTLAKDEMAILYATSFSENIGAATVNETMRSYAGTPTDLVMVNNMLALSYLFANNIDAARVEILQADIMMKKIIKSDSTSGQLASAHVLSAIIYELLDETSNALISYRFAAEIIEQNNIHLADNIKLALVRLSKDLGANDQYDEYIEKYSISKQQLASMESAKNSQIFALHFNGVVDSKKEIAINVPAYRSGDSNDQLIRITMPSYPVQFSSQSTAIIDANNSPVTTAEIESINQLARADLAAEYPAILLATTARAILKYDAVKNAEKKDPLAGFLMNVATVLSESADVRSWNMLPASIQFGYIETSDLNVNIATTKVKQTVQIKPRSKHLILTSSVSDKLFHYDQSIDNN
ncbi:COG3014 family protein [Colwelliaceae bacterium BS250]